MAGRPVYWYIVSDCPNLRTKAAKLHGAKVCLHNACKVSRCTFYPYDHAIIPPPSHSLQSSHAVAPHWHTCFPYICCFAWLMLLQCASLQCLAWTSGSPCSPYVAIPYMSHSMSLPLTTLRLGCVWLTVFTVQASNSMHGAQ